MQAATVLVYERGDWCPQHTQVCLCTETLNLNFTLPIFILVQYSGTIESALILAHQIISQSINPSRLNGEYVLEK